MSFSLLFLCISLTFLQGQDPGIEPLIWPVPVQYKIDDTQKFNVSYSLSYVSNIDSDILDNAFDRYDSINFLHYPRTAEPDNALTLVNVTVKSDSDYLQQDTDESYNLTVTSTSINIFANTVYGALRGIETFSQVVLYNFGLGYYQTYYVDIYDYPRFHFRGILLDCSRHYHNVETLFRLLDAMSYSKMNVFHWHLTDDQSIPYESRTWPRFWNDSWSPEERYSQEDVKEVVKYAKYRGIRVVPEIDMPGHATSWCLGYPLTCPFYSTNGIDPSTNYTCRYPLNPAVNFTFEFIDGLLTEMYDENDPLFFDNMLHLGGDEVNPYCWGRDPTIIDWMNQMNMTIGDTIDYFIQKVESIGRSHGKTIIQWDDSWFYGASNQTIIEAYYNLDPTTVVQTGYKALVSEESNWYLDHLNVTWTQFYGYEPCENVTDSECLNILGGEMSMWSESVDDSDIDQTIWPRSAAGGEKLWSTRDYTDNYDFNTVRARLEVFRCLLNARGIASAPVNNPTARQPPNGSASCYHQGRRLLKLLGQKRI